MKTSRDWLLSRHQSDTAQLDAARLAALRELRPVPPRELLHALFAPNRRLWTALAWTWLIILTVHFSTRPPANEREIPQNLATQPTNWPQQQAQIYALLNETNPNF